MNTREQLNTEIHLETLSQITKLNEQPQAQLTREERKHQAVKKLMTTKPAYYDDSMEQGLKKSFSERKV